MRTRHVPGAAKDRLERVTKAQLLHSRVFAKTHQYPQTTFGILYSTEGVVAIYLLIIIRLGSE